MALAEQPLKKRKLFEPPLESPEPPPTPPPPPPPSLPQPISRNVVAPPLSQEEILIKRRNRDEIRSLYESYKRIRACVSHKDARSMPDLEHAYLSLITASRGCTSVQRIVADLIPKYASYCPTALEAAAKVVIDMHNWSLALINQGEDSDGVAFQTATAAILGLTDICCTASAEAPTSSVIQGICAAVFLNVLTFFVSSFEGKNIFQVVDLEAIKMHNSSSFFSEMKHKISGSDEHPLVKLSKFRSVSLLKIFFSCPKNSLAACFELFSSTSNEDLKSGRWLLSMLTSTLAADYIDHPSNEKLNGPESCTGSTIVSSKTNEVGSRVMTSEGNHVTVEASPFLKNCLLGLALRKDSLLKDWLISKCRSFSKAAALQTISEITSALEGVIESFAELVNLKDNLENDEDCSVLTKFISPSYTVPMVPMVSSRRESSYELSHNEVSNLRAQRRSFDDVPTDPISSQHVGCQGSLVSPDTRSMNFGEWEGSSWSRSSRPKDFISRTSLESRADSFDGKIKPTQMENNHLTVPSCSAASQIVWYFDGDPSSMDICSASKRLWVGLLGPDACEGHVRLQFERFGPVEQFNYSPTERFAVVEYKNIMDAVKARECMRGHSSWGSCLNVKFVGIVDNVSSCHVYVGNVQGPWARDEILRETMKVVRKGPHMVTDLSSESALLVKFETAEEAAASVAHLRRHREATAWQFHARGSYMDTRPVSAPVFRAAATVNMSSQKMENLGAAVPRRNAFQLNQIAPGFTEACEVGVNPSPTGAHVTSEQMWMYKKPEVEFHYAAGNIQCIPPPTIVPPPQIMTPSFARPIYPPNGCSWDARGLSHPYPLKPNLPASMPNNFHGNGVAAPPFLPPSVTPLAQIQGNSSQHFDRTFSVPVPVPPLQCPPPPLPDTLPPLAPSPPPLPQTQPPLVPPPPLNSPPPQPPLVAGSSNSENMQHQWMGALCKSGVHYCMIYAKRVNLDGCKYSNAISEPVEWPMKLDMTKRTDFQHVKTTFTNTPQHKREACWLLPSSAGDNKGFQDFISYLNQRGCAGVIKLPATKSLWARLLFILPHSPDACAMLSVSPKPTECLIAVVLPKETNEWV